MKTLIGVIQSEANLNCQTQWIENLKKIHGDFEVLIVENSFSDNNFEMLKSVFKHVLKGPYFNTVKERIIENRNVVLDWFRTHEEYDKLLFLDTDIFPPAETLQYLLACDKKIVGTTCWITGKAGTIRVAWNFFKKDVEAGKSEDWMKGAKENKNYIRPEGKIVEIEDIGLGCTLFDGEILRKEKHIKFRENGMMLNEDYTFIKDLRDEYYKIHMHMKVNCFHDLSKYQGGGMNG